MLRSTFLVFGLVLISQGLADRISESGRSELLGLDAGTQCTGLYSCSDCHTARVCRPTGDGKWTQVMTIPCPMSTPYCDTATGTCSVTPDPTCGQTDTFICPSDTGHYPDPKNCSVYHVCEGYTSKAFACANGLTYNPDSEDCEKNASCGTVDCGNQIGQKAPFTNYPTYFAYCNGANVAIVDKCQGVYELNVTSQECEATCHKGGLIQNSEDCTKYYLCSKMILPNNEPFIMKETFTCPQGQGFNPSKYMCVSLDELDNCRNQQSTTLPPTTKP